MTADAPGVLRCFWCGVALDTVATTYVRDRGEIWAHTTSLEYINGPAACFRPSLNCSLMRWEPGGLSRIIEASLALCSNQQR